MRFEHGDVIDRVHVAQGDVIDRVHVAQGFRKAEGEGVGAWLSNNFVGAKVLLRELLRRSCSADRA